MGKTEGESTAGSADDAIARAAALAAADDARIRRRRLAIGGVTSGILLVAASLLLWPRGLFALFAPGGEASAVSTVLLISGGALALTAGVVLVTASARRLPHLRNHLTSTGKPDAAFVNEPDFGMPQIGTGHGGPLDASAAQFANPGKVLRGRS